MNRLEILELLLKDNSHDELIERPELYSIEEDITQWMFEMRNEWNNEFQRLMELYRKESEELKREEPEYYWQHEAKYDTEDNYSKRAYRHYHRGHGHERSYFHGELAWFWRNLLTKRPEFAPRCPWRSFRGDMIWMTLQDKEFCKAVGLPKKELALKMPLKLMSPCDWDELLKTVPELKTERDRLLAEGYKFEAYCL